LLKSPSVRSSVDIRSVSMTDLVEGPTRVGFRQLLARGRQALHGARSPVMGYALSILAVAIALAVALPAEYYGFRDLGLPVLTLAVGVTAWYASTGPLALAVVLAAAGYDYFFTAPFYSFNISAEGLAHLMVFLVWAMVVASFGAVRRRAEDSL